MTSVMQRMYTQVAVEGEAKLSAESMPAVAKAYVLRVMQTAYPNMTIRNLHDLRFLATVMDHMITSRIKEAGDLVAQQFKVLEQVLDDHGSWERARYLSLMDLETGKLVDKEERHAINSEARADRREYWANQRPKGGGGQKGSGAPPAWAMWPGNSKGYAQGHQKYTKGQGKQGEKGKGAVKGKEKAKGKDIG